LARPGGNITGFFLDIPEMSGKQLQLLREAKPNLARIAVLGHPRINELQFSATETAAQRTGVTLQQLPVKSLNEIDEMIVEARRQRARALLALSNPLVLRSIQRIADAARKYQLPTICPYTPVFAEAGGLMAYGPNLPDLVHRAGGHAARILKGAKPGDLPVQRPERFDFVINLKTARVLKLELATHHPRLGAGVSGDVAVSIQGCPVTVKALETILARTTIPSCARWRIGGQS
jgi:putative ABC transport system substrate-binding protein